MGFDILRPTTSTPYYHFHVGHYNVIELELWDLQTTRCAPIYQITFNVCFDLYAYRVIIRTIFSQEIEMN